tara:strand:+ start:746 stop:2233 length:1488 start_codon:yes stop_codon:yes gene_type:complete
MGFDWKAFGAAFLDKQTEGIRKRRTDAEEYEEEQEELAKANRKAIADRTLLASEYGSMAEKAMALGATKEQVMAAMGSGAMGIKTFYEKLLAAANQKGMQTLGAADVEAIIEMPEVFEVNPAYVDMKVGEMAKIMYGAKTDPTLAPEAESVQTSDSILASMFGVDAMSKAKQRLGDTTFMGNMSIEDVNELAAQSEYNSLFPNLGVNFFDRQFYGPEAAGEFVKDLTNIEVDAIDSKAQERINKVVAVFNARITKGSPSYDEEFAERMKAEGYTSVDAAEDAKEDEIGNAARAVIDTTVGLYGQTGLFDHEPSVNLMKRLMGEEYVVNQMRELGLMPDEDEEEDNTTAISNAEADASSLEDLMSTPEGDTDDSQPEETTQTETTQTQAPDTEAQKEALLAKTFPKRPSGLSANSRGWDRDYKGKVDPESGKVIIAPPRPADGGEKTKTVRNENMFGIRQGPDLKLTEAEYWDRTYGETHDPTSGLPFGYETLLED